jgi:cytochrome c oxidase subunit 4
MSTVTKAPPGHTDHESHGPPDSTYVLVAAFLAIVTALEVSVTYIHAFRRSHTEIPVLLVLMAIKFFTVTYMFMHLKYDPPMCRRVFNFGLGLAVFVFVVALAMFHFWAPHYT